VNNEEEDEDGEDGEDDIMEGSTFNRRVRRVRSGIKTRSNHGRRMRGVSAQSRSHQINLPEPPLSNKLNHQLPLHESEVNLSNEFNNLDSISPLQLFKLFFTDIILRAIVNNTNKYGRNKKQDL